MTNKILYKIVSDDILFNLKLLNEFNIVDDTDNKEINRRYNIDVFKDKIIIKSSIQAFTLTELKIIIEITHKNNLRGYIQNNIINIL